MRMEKFFAQFKHVLHYNNQQQQSSRLVYSLASILSWKVQVFHYVSNDKQVSIQLSLAIF